MKKIPKKPEEKEKKPEKDKKAKKEEESKDEKKDEERSPSRAPIELRSRSLTRKPQDSRTDSAQASKGRGKVAEGAKRFLARAVQDAANDVGRRAKKKG